MADGGCNSPGDIAKAFAAGADFVMLGGLFAGHDESGELIETKDGRLFKSFHGMSSSTAMERHYGEVAKHRAPEEAVRFRTGKSFDNCSINTGWRQI